MKYEYDVGLEGFRRTDRRGKPLYVNITEANRIINLLNLGHSVADIKGKVSLSSPMGTITTINSFIRNYNEGNIIIPEDVPAPTKAFESLVDGDRISRLEERVSKLEEIMCTGCTCDEKSNISKVKSWLKF